MNTFLNQNIEPEKAAYHIIPFPHQEEMTYRQGAKKGPGYILKASKHLEYYDFHTDTEPYTKGIYTTNPQSPETLILPQQKTPIILGGDHSSTIHIEKHLSKDTDILIFDAHPDMHYSWKGSKQNHACVTRRLQTKHNVHIAGLRSGDKQEITELQQNPKTTYNTVSQPLKLQNLKQNIHISIDVDVLTPSLIPHTGTPEPGGYTYNELLTLLEQAHKQKKVKSIDIVEFTPTKKEPVLTQTQAFTLAKLLYTLIGLHIKHGK